MIFISDVIRNLETIKEVHGDLPVLIACQVQPHVVNFDVSIENSVEIFHNKNKTVEIKALVVKGYKE